MKRYKNNWFVWGVILTILISFSSCSPIKRHQRLVEKYPFVHTQDTVIIVDTITMLVPKTEIDTVFLLKQLHDTITIEKERLKIRMYAVHDSIYIDAKCDTIIVEKIIERKIPIIHYAEKTKFVVYAKWGSLMLLLILAVYLIIKKIENGISKKD